MTRKPLPFSFRILNPVVRGLKSEPWAPALNAVLSVLLAPLCAGCSAVLDAPLDGCVCRNCWMGVERVDDLDHGEYAPLSRLISLGSYDGTLRDIVHALKYQGRRSIARHLATHMRERSTALLACADCVVPVPLHWRREYSRGFNQAREIARHLGPPIVEALVRRRATTPQVELSADRRAANVRDAFGLRSPPVFRASRRLEGCTAVLVDDVATTGATLESCARVLRGAGAAEVWGLTAARRT
jgi:ComF family protein